MSSRIQRLLADFPIRSQTVVKFFWETRTLRASVIERLTYIAIRLVSAIAAESFQLLHRSRGIQQFRPIPL
jgi:hypothetical protein